jgi:hypothetical protein
MQAANRPLHPFFIPLFDNSGHPADIRVYLEPNSNGINQLD